MSLMSICCQSICWRTGCDVLLDVVQELAEQDLVGLEMDAAAVAKAEIDRRSPAGGLGHHRLELAPGPQDLVDLLVLRSRLGSP